MHFSPENLDFERSPYTGLTRKHWIDAGKYICLPACEVD